MKNLYFLLLTLGFITVTKAQIISFPDPNFKSRLLSTHPNLSIAKNLSGNNFAVDANSNGEIEISEALQVSYLDLSNSNISSIVGIFEFTNLKTLYVSSNPISTVNLNGLNNLEDFACYNGQLTELDLRAFPNLKKIACSNNPLTILRVNGLTNLQTLHASNCQLTSLDLEGLTSLTLLVCQHNQLTSLELRNLTRLMEFFCYNNFLTSLEINNLPALFTINCSNNQLQTLNLNNLGSGGEFNCSNNNLISLFAKSSFNSMNFSGNPNLQYICVNEDEGYFSYIQSRITSLGLTNCHVNSYCAFTPGDAFYMVQGSTKYDSANNGCDVSDITIPNLNFAITNGTTSGNIISNSSGNFSVPIQAGSYTITPIIENQSYFNFNPTSLSVNFPTNPSPMIQNFCITPNGVHSDVEITIIPTVPARPGFNATYKIIYKNNGTQIENGNIVFNFEDALLSEVVSAFPSFSTETPTSLTWNYTNLQPLEQREIKLILEINSPLETPAVNIDDILGFSTVITIQGTDENHINNSFGIKQKVVGSFDPNDKTCLQGTTIAPSEVGKYVNYLIRFENTGTYPAENVVVKDIIDTAKFDIATLVPIKGSHPFVTNIHSGNKVEFIFENINLPFDDANNDGYVAFKIKTKPTLVVGNTFSNSANIYFDYNRPILTNTATTTIQTLSNQDFNFSSYFAVYPNPVKNTLNIEAKDAIEVQSISIYNTLGQLLQVILNAQSVKSVDVSNLPSGNYLVKITSVKGTSNTKFIKS